VFTVQCFNQCIQEDYNHVAITMHFYLVEDTCDDEFKLLSFIWMFKVLTPAQQLFLSKEQDLVGLAQRQHDQKFKGMWKGISTRILLSKFKFDLGDVERDQYSNNQNFDFESETQTSI
jgi:hypothetical protein